MSCKSGIYAVNTGSATLAAGAVYAPTTIVRRFGPSVQMADNGISISGAGYYKVNATVVATASAVGTVTATLYKDGVAVTGATATATASAIGDVVALPINALVRMNCNCQESTLTIVVSGQSVTTNNLSIVVEKE